MFLLFLLSLVGSVVIYHATGAPLLAAGFIVVILLVLVFGVVDAGDHEVI